MYSLQQKSLCSKLSKCQKVNRAYAAFWSKNIYECHTATMIFSSLCNKLRKNYAQFSAISNFLIWFLSLIKELGTAQVHSGKAQSIYHDLWSTYFFCGFVPN